MVHSKHLIKHICYALVIWVVSVFIQLQIIESQFCGNFYWATLSSSFFKQPIEVQKNAGPPFFQNKNSNGEIPVGWDGQFYYLVANNLYINPGYEIGLDAPAYRYQRIGLPITGNILSSLSKDGAVSPFTYWLSNQIVFLFGLLSLSLLFMQQKISVHWLWLWSFSVGAQSSLLHGLGDVAADSYFLIGLFFISKNRLKLSLVPLTLAILCREIYILFSFSLFFYWLISQTSFKRKFRFDSFFLKNADSHIVNELQKSGFIYLAPMALYILWYSYIKLRTGIYPSLAGPQNIIGPPLKTMLDKVLFSIEALKFDHIFASLIFSSIIFCLLTTAIKNRQKSLFFLTVLPVVILVSCLGTDAFDLYRDYLKGLLPALALAPFFLNSEGLTKKVLKLTLIISIFAQPTLYFMMSKREANTYPLCESLKTN